jgi:RNA polymerase sigma-70 factor (ECF subfamily)
VRPGSEEDFDRLYRECYPRLLRMLYGVLGEAAAAEDCVQEAFEKAYRAWPRFRPERPPEAWLHQIALNVAISYRRRARTREGWDFLRRLGRPEPAPEPVSSDLIQALSSLPPQTAAAFILRHYHGYSNREVGELLGLAERTVRLRLAEARTLLARKLDPERALPVSTPPRVALQARDA